MKNGKKCSGSEMKGRLADIITHVRWVGNDAN